MNLATATPSAPHPISTGIAAKSNSCRDCTARSLSVCGAMQSEDLGRLASVAGQQHLPASKTFLNEGDDATHFFNITSGAVKVYKLLPNGRRQITGFLFTGDLLGLAFNDTYTYSAETLTEVYLCRFPRGQFEGLIESFPKMEHRLLAMASNELAAAQEQMLLLGRKSALERVASFLIRMSTRGAAGEAVDLPMSRSDIADYLGLTIETVSRTFTQLERDRAISMPSSRHIVLHNRLALADI